MDYFRDMQNVGGNIRDMVNEAIEKNDYSNLAKNITEEMAQFTKATVKSAFGPKVYTTSKGYRPVDIDLGTRKGQQRQYSHTQQSQQRRQRQQNYNQQRQQSYNQQRQQGYNQQGQQAYNQQRQQSYNQQRQQSYNQQRQQNQQGNFSNYNTSGKSQFWGSGYGRDAGQSGGNQSNYGNSSYYNNQRPGAQSQNRNPSGYTVNPATGNIVTPFNQYKKNAGSGLAKQGAGLAGLMVTVPALLTSAAAAVATGGVSAIITAAIFGAGAGASGYYTSKGIKQRKLSKIFDKYSKIVGNAEYMTIEDLAEKSGETPEMVAKNLDEMIQIGMLPQLKFDQGKTTMMLTKNAYDQYLLAENSRKEREREEAKLDEQAGSAEARKVITEGELFVTKIKKANDLIPGQEMSDKLDQMERIVSKIFAQVRKDPSSAGDLRKFMNYYLPTTEKLLNAYIDLDKQPEVGENIIKTKKEIEDTVDTINNAFENLLDSLFQEVAWDISSDISVMKTMMEQDGLTKKGIGQDSTDADIADIKKAVDFTSKSEKVNAEDEPSSAETIVTDAASSAETIMADVASKVEGIKVDAAPKTEEVKAEDEPILKIEPVEIEEASEELKPELKFGDE